MSKLNQRGFAHIFLLLILLVGIAGGVYLVAFGDPLKLFSKAAPTLPSAPETSFELELEKNGETPFPDETTPTSLVLNSTFRVDIYARSDVEAANLFNAKIKYTSDTADFVAVEKRDGQSFVKNWVDASIDNSNTSVGVISMVGGVPSPGIQTDSNTGALLMGSIIFKAKKTGILKVEVSDASTIYSNTNNINILTARKGTIEVPIQDVIPSPSPSPAAQLSCDAISVSGAILGKAGGQTIYIVDSEGKANLEAYVSPANSKVVWTGWNSKNLPNGGVWNPSDNPVTVWTAPKNNGNQMEGVQVRADIANTSPVVSCPAVNMAVKPAVQEAPSTSVFGKAAQFGQGKGAIIMEKPAASNLSNLNPKGVMTMEAWVRVDVGFGANDSHDILHKVATFDTPSGVSLLPRLYNLTIKDNQLQASIVDTFRNKSGTVSIVFPTDSSMQGVWRHVAVLYDGSEIRIFINGTHRNSGLVNFDTPYPVKDDSQPFYIGRYPNALFSPTIITIDEVRISKGARYWTNDFAKAFTPSMTPFASDANTLGLWHLDGTAQDSSSNANHGSIKSDPTNLVEFVDSTIGGVTPVTYSFIEFLEAFGSHKTLKDPERFNPKYDFNNDLGIDIVDYSGLVKRVSDGTIILEPLKSGFTTSGYLNTHNKKQGESGFDTKYDIDTNNTVNVEDYKLIMVDSSTTDAPSKGNGDGNKDGKIDLADLSVLLTDFDKGNFRVEIDLNGDGKINTFDFSLLKNLLIEKKVIKG